MGDHTLFCLNKSRTESLFSNMQQFLPQ